MLGTLTIARPAADEHIEYYGKYIRLVPGDDALDAMRSQIGDTVRLLQPLDESKALHRYGPGKWSVKEVVGHITDAERVFSYRALRFGRADETPVPGFDENTYVPAGRFDLRPLPELLHEYQAVRASTIALFRGMDEQALLRRGTANWILAGHELHHRGILIERYGLGK